jgi:hypothetical protein
MDIVYPCTYCGYKIAAPEQFAGREVKCPQCREVVCLPSTLLDIDELTPTNVLWSVSHASQAATAENERVVVRCDQCFQQYIVPAASVDYEFVCAKCQHTFRVPAAALDAARGAVVGGIEKLKAGMAAGAMSLSEQSLAELALLDQSASEGTPLRRDRDSFAWAPKKLRRSVAAAMNWIEEHPFALVAIVAGTGAWAAVLLYCFR